MARSAIFAFVAVAVLALAFVPSPASAQSNIPSWAANCPSFNPASGCGCAPNCLPTKPMYNCTLPPGVLRSVNALFPEGSTPDPSLLGNLAPIKIFFNQRSNINFTFVTEGAGYRNQFGYFLYNQTNINLPGVAWNFTTVFPDVSFPDTGCLRSGYTVYAGVVPANTYLGFWVTADGYNGGTDRWVSFTDGTNNLKNVDNKNHTGFVYLSDLNTTLFGFEDLNGLGDKDYNDVMFTFATDGIIDLSQIPRYEGGLIQTCRVGVIAPQDYLEYKCQQWALLSPPSGASCNSFLQPPSGWTFALNSSEVLEMLNFAGTNTFTRTLGSLGCAVVPISLADGSFANYTASGTVCAADPAPTMSRFGTSNCFAVPCAHRLLVKGSAVASCTVNTFEFCDPSVSGRVTSRVPSSIPVPGDVVYPSTQTYPSTTNVYLTKGGINLNLNVSVLLKSPLQGGVAADLYIMLDMVNSFSKDRDYLSQALIEFYNEITNPDTIGFDYPNIGFGTFRRSSAGVVTFTNNCPLNPDVTTIKDCIAGVSFNNLPDSTDVQNIPAAYSQAMSAMNGQFRSFAYKMIIIITDNPSVTSTTFADTEIQYNVVPMFYLPNPTSTNAANYTVQSNMLPLARRITGTIRSGSSSNLRSDRLQNWYQSLPPLVKALVQNVTLSRMINNAGNTIPNTFLRTIAAPYDVSALPAAQQYNTFNRQVTVGWPSSLNADLATFPIRTTVTVMGFGTTDIMVYTNRAPTAPDTPVTTDEDVPITFTIAASDIDNNLLRVRFLNRTNSALGVLATDGGVTVALNTYYNTTTFKFTPAANANGVAVLAFDVSDGCAASAIRLLTITVRPVNDPPTARNFTIYVSENSATVTNVFDILFNSSVINDIDNPVDSLLLTVLTVPDIALGDLREPTSSTLIRSSFDLGLNRRLTYTPAAYQDGTSSFNYRVSDGSLSADATVTIVIVDARWPPVLSVVPNPITANTGTTASITITVNDPDGRKASYGETAFLRVSAINLHGSNKVSVPTGTPDILPSGANMDWTTAAAVSTAGTYSWTATWSAFNPNTPQNFTLVAVDAQGKVSNSVVVRLIVSGNQPPYAVNHTASITLAEDTSFGPFTLQGSDDDGKGMAPALEEWRTLQIQFPGLPRFGSLRFAAGTVVTSTTTRFNVSIYGSLNTAAQTSAFQFIYTPVPDYNGPDSFTYVFFDVQEGSSITYTTTITVTPVNDRPTTSNFTVTMNEYVVAASPVVTPVNEFSAFDADTGDVLSLVLRSIPARGKLKFNGVQIVNSAIPFNVGGVANWATALTYEPPFLEYSDPDGSVYSSFLFQVCDNSGVAATNCSVTSMVSLIVNFVNTPPLSESFDVYTPENTPVSFSIDVRDPDLRHPDSVLFAIVTSLGVRNKGTLYLCAQMNSACELTVDRLNQPISAPRTLWYMPALDDFSPDASSPSATLTFQVGDDTVNTAFTYTIRVFVDFVNDPPEWLAATTYNIDEDTNLNLFTLTPSNWYDDLLRVPSNQNNPPVPVVSFSVLSIPSRGSLSLCRANGTCFVVTSDMLPATSDDSLGRILFRPEANEWANNYGQFVFALKDSGIPYGPSKSLNVTITVNVISVNDPPVFQALDFTTIAQGGDGPVLNEDSKVQLTWRLTDIDSLPEDLVTRVRTSQFSRAGWNVFSCINDGFAGCSRGAVITNSTDNFKEPVLRYETRSTGCNYRPGYPIASFDDCYAEFTFEFEPEKNRYQIPFIQLAFVGFDQIDEADPSQTVISVLPVNDAPFIYAPPLISPAAGVVEMQILDDTERPTADAPFVLPAVSADLKTKGVFVWDIDSSRGAVLLLTAEIIDGDGEFVPTRQLGCNQTSDYVWECRNTLTVLNKYLRTSTFKIGADAGYTEATVRWTINDLGNTSPENNVTELSASTTTRFVYTKLPEIAGTPPGNNTLTLAAGIAAAAGLILIALLAWRLRNALKAPDDKYFEVATSPLSVAPTNPLFKPQFQERQNPLYNASK
eukprot:TRINITY_DN9779_c6_g1_i1.p1 TRINITY_DN9779_c6_g1~~TRINITY_DN9779_c6_g1_i1.p1  ORF type:complete len:1990 (+),score=505.24 TRINITY_DN9779_c6_g1_i1:206-6175(+)